MKLKDFISPRFNATVICLAVMGIASAVSAQSYPNKPITIVAPFVAGGDADQSARNLATVAQNVLKQSVIVVNKGGASGAIGSQFVKDAAPDGYTLLLARVGSQAVLPAMKSDLSYKWNDFTFIGLLELNPVVCVVNAESPYKTFEDLTKAITAQPGKLNYSSSGPGTILNFASQLILQSLKLKPDAAMNVSYKGGSEAVVAVLAKEVDFSCGNLTSALTQINSSKLRALVVTTPERVKEIPTVPTAKEVGMPQLEAIVGWSALYGPPKMSPEIVNKWVEVLGIADKDANWQAGNVRYGGIPRILSPMDTEKFAVSQYVTYSKLSSQLGIK